MVRVENMERLWRVERNSEQNLFVWDSTCVESELLYLLDEILPSNLFKVLIRHGRYRKYSGEDYYTKDGVYYLGDEEMGDSLVPSLIFKIGQQFLMVPHSDLSFEFKIINPKTGTWPETDDDLTHQHI